MKEGPIELKRATEEFEYEKSAHYLSSNEPWLTLGRSYEYSLEKVHSKLSELYVIKYEDEIIGCVLLQMLGELKGYLRNIIIDQNYQGKSIGKTVLKMIQARIFQESPNVFLTVSSFNTKAIDFYIRNGYEKIGSFKNYIIDGHDEILMRKTIGPSKDYKVVSIILCKLIFVH